MDILADIAHIFGTIFILLGIFIVFAPRALIRTAEHTNRLFNVDGLVFAHRRLFGILLILAAAYLAWVFWRV